VPVRLPIPKPLLADVDRRARHLGISRNRFIVLALEKALTEEPWSPGFFERLADVDEDHIAGVLALEASIQAARTRTLT
jgi:metal-responsive CopG/Arc/MetJ family transcriptional regulator